MALERNLKMIASQRTLINKKNKEVPHHLRRLSTRKHRFKIQAVFASTTHLLFVSTSATTDQWQKWLVAL